MFKYFILFLFSFIKTESVNLFKEEGIDILKPEKINESKQKPKNKKNIEKIKHKMRYTPIANFKFLVLNFNRNYPILFSIFILLIVPISFGIGALFIKLKTEAQNDPFTFSFFKFLTNFFGKKELTMKIKKNIDLATVLLLFFYFLAFGFSMFTIVTINYTYNFLKTMQNINKTNSYVGIFNNYVMSDEKKKEIKNFVELYLFGAKLKKKPTVALFTGVAGTGKTMLAKKIHSEFFSNISNEVYIDGAQFKNATDSSSALLASLLCKNNNIGLVIVDEFEKMHKNFQNFFLNLFDTGEMSITYNLMFQGGSFQVTQKINLNNKLIVIIANTGQEFFVNKEYSNLSIEEQKELCYNQIVKDYGMPNISRLDEIFYFFIEEFSFENLNFILSDFKNNLLYQKNINLKVNESVVNCVPAEVKKFGFRKIENFLCNEILKLLMEKEIFSDTSLEVFVNEDGKLDIEEEEEKVN